MPSSVVQALAQAQVILRDIFKDLHDQGQRLQRYPGTYEFQDPYENIDEWNASLQERYRRAAVQIGNETMAIAMHAKPFQAQFLTANHTLWYKVMLLLNSEKQSLRMFAIVRNIPYVRNYQDHPRNRFLRSLGRLKEHPLTNNMEQSLNVHPHLIYLSDRGDPVRCGFRTGSKELEMINLEENKYSEDRFRQHSRLPTWPGRWSYPRHPQYTARTEGANPNWMHCMACGKPAVFEDGWGRGGLFNVWDEDTICLCTHSSKSPKPWELPAIVEIRQYPPYTPNPFEVNRGVRALQNIPYGTVIGEYCGTFIPLQEEDICGDNVFLMGWQGPSIYYSKGKGTQIAVLSAGLAGNWTRFMNHTFEQEDVNVLMYQEPYGARMRIVVKAVRDILFGEQILTSYGDAYFGKEG